MIFAKIVKKFCARFCEKNELWWRRRRNDFLFEIKKNDLKIFEKF